MKTFLVIITIFTIFTCFVMAEDRETAMWQGFNISGEGDYDRPGRPVFTLYKTYSDKTGTYNDVLKLEPPGEEYVQGSIAMTYTVPIDGYYRLSMWVWADKPEDEDIYIEFEQIGGDWETVAGSREVPVAFREGEWLYVTSESPNGVYLEAGGKFGLLTQSGGNAGVGLNGYTIYIRDLKLEVTSFSNNFPYDYDVAAKWKGFNISGEGDYVRPGKPVFTLHETYRDGTGTYSEVLKLEPPGGGYEQGSIAMSYTVPYDGYYKLSMWVWADKPEDEDIYIEFEQIGGDWETVAGSRDVPAAFREGEWLYVTSESPKGFFLNAGDKFGLLTQSGGNAGVGLNGYTIYIRDLKLEATSVSNNFPSEYDADAKWRGFNISGEGDYNRPGKPIFTLYETYSDSTGTYIDVLKLESPRGGYEGGSIAMTYTAPHDGYYKLSMWVWAEKPEDEDIYIEFEQIGGEWETVAGSRDVPAAFREGEWLYITSESPDGFYLNAGDKFGLLTQSGGNAGVGLNGHTIYIRDLELEVPIITAWKAFSSALKGLSISLEFGIRYINEANDRERQPFLYSALVYGNSFFKDTLYVYAELGFTTGLYHVEKENGGNTYPVDLYLDAYADYSLRFGNSTLAFILKDEMDPYVINPRFDSGRLNTYNKFTPGLVFRQWFDDFGSLYAQVESPIFNYYYSEDNTDSMVYIQYRLGWRSKFGLGVWVREDQILKGDKWEWAEPGHESFNFGLSFWTRLWSSSVEVRIPPPRYGNFFITIYLYIGPFNMKIEADFPKKEDWNSRGFIDLTLTPKYEYTIIDGFSVWAKAVIWEIGRKDRDVLFTPSLGLTYRF